MDGFSAKHQPNESSSSIGDSPGSNRGFSRTFDPHSSKPHVIIIGAGTGGLCLAHGLLKQNLATVTVYERDRTRMDGLQGYRVGISPGGSAVLNYCLPQELYQTFVATCARTPR